MTSTDAIAFESLRLEKAAFEVRYPSAFLFWDRAGEIWSELQQKWPTLTPAEVEPNRTRFQLRLGVDLFIEIGTIRCIARDPERGLGEFRDRCDMLTETVLGTLRVSSLDRVGLRLSYSKETDSRAEASELVFRTGTVTIPPSIKSQLSPDMQVFLPSVSFRIEGNALGQIYRLSAESRRIDFQLPPEAQDAASVLAPFSKERHYLVCDIDHFTTTKIPLSKFRTRDWIESGLRIIRRDGARLLAGYDK